jgi:Acyl-CoA reductase (LuxC)
VTSTRLISDTVLAVAPLVLRGEVVTDSLVEHAGRGGSAFSAPDPRAYLNRIVLPSPAAMADLHQLSFDDVCDYVAELGERLDMSRNAYLQRACELTYGPSLLSKPLVDRSFAGIASQFTRENARQIAERCIGVAYLDGWVSAPPFGGMVASTRAFGARTVHVVPGNGGGGAAGTFLRAMITRSDTIVKLPSNNPFGPAAIAQTMCEMAPDHPITKHTVVAYWRGGDEEFERRLYQPHHVEKIVAWGGFASVKHVTRYVQPGLELISLDPKSSMSIIGAEALASESLMRDVARRLAVDIGSHNQAGCVCARVVYVVVGDDHAAIGRVNEFGRMVHEALINLPPHVSTPAKTYDQELRAHVEALRFQDDWYQVFGGEQGEGSVIVSQLPQPVEFAAMLADRTANIVPVTSIGDVLRQVDAYTQTIGVYPERLKSDLLDVASLYGAQRFVTLGHAADMPGGTAHDGLELERRLCKWIVDLRHQDAGSPYAGLEQAV